MNDEEVRPFADVLNKTFSSIQSADAERSNQIVGTWKKTLCAIHNQGRNLADHSHVVDLKNGILLVETDHPGWIQLLRMNKQFILEGLHRALPQLEIRNIVYRLEGQKVELADVQTIRPSEEKVRSDLQKKYDEEQQKVDKETEKIAAAHAAKAEKNAEKTNLPPELENLFADLKRNMLTNSKN